MAASTRWPDPVECATSLVLADYRWLPSCRHGAFQALLEQDDGIACVYFLAEVELAIAAASAAEANNCGGGGGTASLSPRGKPLPRRTTRRPGWPDDSHNDDGGTVQEASPRQQHPACTTRAVVMVTWTTLYLCDTEANLLRRVPVTDVAAVGVIQDAWVWVRLRESPLGSGIARVPSGADVLLRLVPENESPLAIQRVFLGILSAVAAGSTVAAASGTLPASPLPATGSDFVRVHRDFGLVRLPAAAPPASPPPADMPRLPYAAVWAEVGDPRGLIEHMLPCHQLACRRPPPVRRNVPADPTASRSDAAQRHPRPPEASGHSPRVLSPSPSCSSPLAPSCLFVAGDEESVREKAATPSGAVSRWSGRRPLLSPAQVAKGFHHGEGGGSARGNTPATPPREANRAAPVMWEDSIERMLRHDKSCAPAGKDYVHHIARDLLPRTAAPALSLPRSRERGVSSLTRGLSNDEGGSESKAVSPLGIDPHSYLEPAEAFFSCPPLRL
ncbi:uncharacterized protein Tco025E_01533 [Trypanosoma conorhini]|uniref:Uncharacterized protein n=1 Tax=Trypanosoma conorhini TaxID=83891 RepID=A0A422Q8B3_9TRYP|nr:uncharacterized protein Tco025E_01533 [Trypanosoma conorhini]RNF26225.1 hypothetical protein Tco025E_01533 [Trypanosoma conorhini]